MQPSELWDMVGCCFSDDGNLRPDIEIRNLTASEVGAMYLNISDNMLELSDEATFWDERTESDCPLNSVPNAGQLTATYQASPFHFGAMGISAEGVELPGLGVFVFQTTIVIDYPLGGEWDPDRVLGFFSWLAGLVGRTNSAEVVPAKSVAPPFPERFLAGWGQFLKDWLNKRQGINRP